MLRCVAVGGEPATGKTTMMKNVYSALDGAMNLKYGLVRGHVSKSQNLSLMGIYNEEGTFLGTDRLSMAVNKDFQTFVRKTDRHLIFEGDRLFSKDNLSLIKQRFETRIVVLKAREETLHERHILRGDTQSETFLRGRKTKIQNICDQFGKEVEYHWLTEPEHSLRLAQELLLWIRTGDR